MPAILTSWWLPIIMLCASNVFMTFAWYGHLKRKDAPIWVVIAVAWGIAFFEYLIMVPANRWGSSRYTPYELKIIQEVITLVVFIAFVLIYFGIRPQWNHVVAFAFILAAVAFTFLPKKSP